MADTAIDLGAKAKKNALAITIAGKVTAREEYDGNWYTTVKCAAKDEFSSPQTLRIRSEVTIGVVGDFIEQECEIGGYDSKHNGNTYNRISLYAI